VAAKFVLAGMANQKWVVARVNDGRVPGVVPTVEIAPIVIELNIWPIPSALRFKIATDQTRNNQIILVK
jgi:hypothetical protein